MVKIARSSSHVVIDVRRRGRWLIHSKKIARGMVVGGIVLWMLLPILPLIIWSFSFRWLFPRLLPEQWTLRAWSYLFSPASRLGEALVDTVLIALAVSFIAVLIGIPAGRALGMHHFRGKRIVEFLILAPAIVPGLAVVLGIHVLFIRYGLVGTLSGVILVHLIPAVPYTVLVMAGIFSNYDPDYEAQARTLGAGPLRTFWYVTMPAILPGIVIGALFAFLISWNQYILTLIVAGGQVVTLPLLLFSFASGADNAITAALSIVLLAPALLAVLLSSRYLKGGRLAVRGFTPL